MSRLNLKSVKEKDDPLDLSSLDLSQETIPDSPKLVRRETGNAKMVGRPRKRAQNENEFEDDSHAMSKMIQSIGDGIQKTLNAKRRKMEQFVEASLKSSTEKLESFFSKQQIERQKIRVFYMEKIEKSLTEWQSTIDGIKNSNIKIQKLFLQQQKLIDDALGVKDQKIKLLEQLTKDFIKETESLENQQKSTQSIIQNDLKNELNLLQKKMLSENQQLQMDKMRKSFTSMYQI